MDTPIRYPISHNRRFLPRIATSFIVRIQAQQTSMKGIDISCMGMKCQSDSLFPIDSKHSCNVMLPGQSKSLDLAAKIIAWVPYRGSMAMRMLFQDVSETNRLRLAKWMAHHAVVTL